MAKLIARTVVNNTLVGVAIAAATYFFFTSKPDNPADGVYISYREQRVPAAFLGSFAKNISLPAGNDLDAYERRLKEYFGYYDSVLIGSYRIENQSGRIVDDLSVTLTPPLSTYIKDDSSGRSIEGGSLTTTSLKILPGNTASLSLLLKDLRFEPDEKFTINGRLLPIFVVEPRFRDPFSEFLSHHPILSFVLYGVGSFTLLFGGAALILNYFVKSEPDDIARAADNNKLAEQIAILNYIGIDNPRRYTMIVSRAQAKYQKMFGSKASLATTEHVED